MRLVGDFGVTLALEMLIYFCKLRFLALRKP